MTDDYNGDGIIDSKYFLADVSMVKDINDQPNLELVMLIKIKRKLDLTLIIHIQSELNQFMIHSQQQVKKCFEKY